jgi:deoxyribonuclease-4
VITHIGSHAGKGYDAVAEQVAAALSAVLDATPPEAELMLENSAGAGGLLGSNLSELGDLIRRAGSSPRLRVVLDTAHLCAAGWDFGRLESAERLVEELDREVGTGRLAVIHANDSMAPCGSRRDRHANIGEGSIGIKGFGHLLAQPQLAGVPWILETPNLEHRVADQARLRSLVEEPYEVARGA